MMCDENVIWLMVGLDIVEGHCHEGEEGGSQE